MTLKSQHSNFWTLRNGASFCVQPWGVMGIVNLSPDSFFDNGRYGDANSGLSHAKALWNEGAHILDLGAESSRPGANPVSAEEEIKRLMPVLKSLMVDINQAKQNANEHVPYISVDTYHAQTASVALELGVHIINDISACCFDPELLEVVAHFKPGYVLMHSTGRPKVMQDSILSGNIVDNLQSFFELHLKKLVQAGLPESNIVLDLGIGFGKSFEQNMELISNIHKFRQLGFPLLIAISMKSFLATLVNRKRDDFSFRAKATQILTNILAMQGFGLHRVHHVADTICTLKIAQQLIENGLSVGKYND